jgi:hypothetical protein
VMFTLGLDVSDHALGLRSAHTERP